MHKYKRRYKIVLFVVQLLQLFSENISTEIGGKCNE
jgi:hypothetical protein